MIDYYFLSGADEPQGTIAFAPGVDKAGHELIEDLKDVNEVPFDFTLKSFREVDDKLVYGDDFSGIDNIWSDFPPNEFAWVLMSAKMREVIEVNLTGQESIDWLSCRVKHGREERMYYVLRFNKLLDVLNVEKTVYVKGTDHIIKPVFQFEKIRQYSIFYYPAPYDLWRIPAAVYVAESVKKAIEEAKLTDIYFVKTRVV